MKRDMDLARKIMLAIEASERPLDSTLIRISGYAGDSVTEHMRLLTEAGLIEGISSYSVEHRLKWIELRLTWGGHDFLDAARNETLWNEIMTAVRAKTGSVSFDVLKGLLANAARETYRHSDPFAYAGRSIGRGRRFDLREQPR